MKRFAPLVALTAFLVCGSAYAMSETVWDFRGQVPVRIEVQNLTTVQNAEQGLLVQSSTDGFITLPPLEARADTLTLTLTNATTPAVALIWRTPELGDGEYYQANIDLPTGQSQDVTLVLNALTEWQWDAPTLGLAFPAGSEVLIETMEWRSYSAGEKFWNGIVSFWTPDQFRLYSINFLWGPLISTTPEARATLFDALPPNSWSATRFLYAVFALAAVTGTAYAWSKPDRLRTIAVILAVAGAGLWILFDVRMTQEILSYVRADWTSYILAPSDEGKLRSHSSLYYALAETKELLGDDPTYVLLAEEGTPFFANVRYVMYPAVPITPEEATGNTAWIVLGNARVSTMSGTLLRDGVVLSERGAVVKRFDDTSFFYRSRL